MERTHSEELHIPRYAIPWWFVCRVRTKALQGKFRSVCVVGMGVRGTSEGLLVVVGEYGSVVVAAIELRCQLEGCLCRGERIGQ